MELTPEGFQYRIIDPKERLQIRLRSSAQQVWQAWRVFSGNKLALIGLALLCIYLFMAAVYPLLMGNIWPKGIYNPVTGHDVNIFPHPSPPSSRHLLGTDTLGRDVLSMLMAAMKPSLQMAFTAALLAAISGTLVAAFSAYFRGFTDTIFSHLADLTMLAPAPILMVVIGFMWDIDPFEFGVIYGILVGIGAVSVVLRAYAISVLNRTFIQAAKVAGGGAFHIIFRHLIPHMLPLAAVNMLLTVTGAIFANGFIAFLGLSRAQLNWGSMIYDSFTYQSINGKITWNVLIPAALAISLFAASFYLIALGLQDVVDPRLAQKREQSEYSARSLRN